MTDTRDQARRLVDRVLAIYEANGMDPNSEDAYVVAVDTVVEWAAALLSQPGRAVVQLPEPDVDHTSQGRVCRCSFGGVW